MASSFGPKNPTPEKLIPYESGSASTGAQHLRLSVKFYLTAILFVVFDIELIFIWPWATLYRQLGWFGFGEMMVFLGILMLGFLYIWKKKGLVWE